MWEDFWPLIVLLVTDPGFAASLAVAGGALAGLVTLDCLLTE